MTDETVAPIVDAEVIPVVLPEVAPVVAGPEIVYLDEAAKAVVFTVNPAATKYEVRGDGLIIESM